MINFLTISLIILITTDLCFTAQYGQKCHVDQEEEQQCGASETCCSRTITALDDEHNEIVTEMTAGCCPYKDGVCCSDVEGCCPNGYTCDSQNRRCLKEHQPVGQPLLTCADGSFCPSGQSCCPLSGSSNPSYGCCPYDPGVCCLNPVGCCPHGYICLSTGSCRSYLTDEIIPMTPRPTIESHQTRSTEEEVEMLSLNKREWDGQYTSCPNGSKCLSGHTCCKLDDSSRLTTPYACCPYYEAVCCKNSNFCCPANKPCDPTTNQCVTKSTKRDVEDEYTPAYRMD